MDSDNPEEELITFLIQQQAANADSGASDAALLSELQGLRLKDLRKRAKDMGTTSEELEAAMDEDEPEKAVIGLILAMRETPPLHNLTSGAEDEQRLLTELQAMRLKDLRRRAKDIGVSADVLESAMDADEPEAAVIGMIVVQSKTLAAADKPHFGSAPAAATPAPATPAASFASAISF